MSKDLLTLFLQHWVQSTNSHGQAAKRQHSAADLPPRIHIFWDAGFGAAPEIVQLCAQSWQRFHPDWDVILLDQEDANQILPRDTFPEGMSVTHYADMLRTTLLRQNGGIWVDASCLCLRPLDDWLPNIFNQCGFFAFHKPGPDRLISSWFLAASQDSVVVDQMQDIFSAYWDWNPHQNGKPPYFWFHYLFEHLVAENRAVRSRWGHAPKLSAVPVHQLKRVLSKGIADNTRIQALIKTTPVQKLTHKQELTGEQVQRYLRQIGIDL